MIPVMVNISSQSMEVWMNPIMQRKDVLAATGLCYTSIFNKMRSGTFPSSKQLSVRRVGWLRTEVDAWIDGLQSSYGAAVVQSWYFLESSLKHLSAQTIHYTLYPTFWVLRNGSPSFTGGAFLLSCYIKKNAASVFALCVTNTIHASPYYVPEPWQSLTVPEQNATVCITWCCVCPAMLRGVLTLSSLWCSPSDPVADCVRVKLCFCVLASICFYTGN